MQSEYEKTAAELEKCVHADKAAMLAGKLEELKKAQSSGPAIVELEPKDLPQGLEWHNGMDEPDIGDPQAVKGGGINLWNPTGFPDTLRPFGPHSNTYFNYSLYDSVEMKLVGIHPQTGSIIPGLAAEWAVSEEGKTVFFRLHPRAAYSDGEKVRARDFLLNICLRSSSEAGDPYYLNLYRSLYSSVRTYGNDVIAVTMREKRPMMAYMACRELFPANPLFYSGFNSAYPVKYQWLVPPSTGGYTVSRQDVFKGRRIIMRRVGNWWAKDLRFYRNTCNVDSITHHFISDENRAIEKFFRGEIDAMTVYKPEIWRDRFENELFYNGFIRRVRLETEYPRPPFGLFMNAGSPLLRDINVRKGIQHAINMPLVIEQVFYGDMERAGSYAGGYGPFTDKEIQAPEYSPDKARRFFALAGYAVQGKDGVLRNEKGERLQVELTYADMSPTMVAVSRLLKQYALPCGLDLKLDPLESSVCSKKVFEKRHQIAFWAWPLPYPLPEFYGKFHSVYAYDDYGRLIPHTDNIVSIADGRLDAALEDEMKARDEDEYRKAAFAVQQRLDELAVWVPGWESRHVRVAFWRWVKWPETKETRFCYPAIYDPLESHLYWIDEKIKKTTLDSKENGKTFDEYDETIPMK